MHIDTPVFFLLVLVAMLFRWLTSAANKAAKKTNEPAARSTSTTRKVASAPEESDADRIRKFLEALGQPPGSRPPPVVRPRTEIPLRPVAPVKPPPSAFSIPQGRLARKILPRETTKPAYQEKPSVAPVTEPPVFETREETTTPTEPELPPLVATPAEAYVAVTREATLERKDINRLLKSSSGLRDAIVLREIFGPPRSLQPFDLVGSA